MGIKRFYENIRGPKRPPSSCFSLVFSHCEIGNKIEAGIHRATYNPTSNSYVQLVIYPGAVPLTIVPMATGATPDVKKASIHACFKSIDEYSNSTRFITVHSLTTHLIDSPAMIIGAPNLDMTLNKSMKQILPGLLGYIPSLTLSTVTYSFIFVFNAQDAATKQYTATNVRARIAAFLPILIPPTPTNALPELALQGRATPTNRLQTITTPSPNSSRYRAPNSLSSRADILTRISNTSSIMGACTTQRHGVPIPPPPAPAFDTGKFYGIRCSGQQDYCGIGVTDVWTGEFGAQKRAQYPGATNKKFNSFEPCLHWVQEVNPAYIQTMQPHLHPARASVPANQQPPFSHHPGHNSTRLNPSTHAQVQQFHEQHQHLFTHLNATSSSTLPNSNHD